MHREDVVEITSLHLGQEKNHKLFTIGMHPWWTESRPDQAQKASLRQLLSQPACLAMGEMGLDNLKGPALSLQMEILSDLLEIAAEMQKPVIIHCVRAFDQLIQLKKAFPSIHNWCIHGYGRHAQLAKQLTREGFYLSLMPGFPDHKYAEIIKTIPLDRFFLETDSMPDVAIDEIYFRISKIMGWDLEHLCSQINQNAHAFFGI